MISLAPLSLLLAAAAQAQPASDDSMGTFTNEEQVYFDGEAGKTPPPWTGVRIVAERETLVWQTIDRFGAVLASEPIIVTPTGWTIGKCSLAKESSAQGTTLFAPGCETCPAKTVPLRLAEQGKILRLADSDESRLRRARADGQA